MHLSSSNQGMKQDHSKTNERPAINLVKLVCTPLLEAQFSAEAGPRASLRDATASLERCAEAVRLLLEGGAQRLRLLGRGQG